MMTAYSGLSGSSSAGGDCCLIRGGNLRGSCCHLRKLSVTLLNPLVTELLLELVKPFVTLTCSCLMAQLSELCGFCSC